ncbi:acyl-CoA dehydrogenase family protein [Nocardia cyriacigeorgica]|uniref:Acyl-CoA dehydrogenase, short-chain specific n=2 Tax=Nocardia cyriacigeorgica TaxID=135487 RepID=A0A4V6ICD5_9NOCA|nr:acyl-CoA dehydrogenase family protein [Nocardia cyriacigeorgica]MBF6090834.1 acyl-CoA dehydrogenase family protein [Nocardia cyriacigeorgica]MBF6100629.1 acyl-CoA dehydrogenase family protein [Nocardia cyriacigeorgica]MBF6159049.1 acyl-CoA dehydrogenase family protein [Nocardia cyriacigeorgica]MBF6197265.1 acyl-CoA dehydrogenase family protein [Nocardia cyriacigeorgica]MBF6344260.1 acyl-CoA dehydrogenase family protein [Nocardia cyriacigeorgica]
MMSTRDSATKRRPDSGRSQDSAVGLNQPKRDWMGAAMRVMTTLTGSELAEKYNLRKPIERVTYEGTKTGFRTLGAATRAFNKVAGGGQPKRLAANEAKNKDYFDLTPTDEQQMIVETVREFAAEILRPAAHDADEAAAAPKDLLGRAAELGITLINVPEELEGAASERGAVTNSMVAEALAHGDMGLALPILAPSGVAVALSQWGTDAQQQTYLPAFTGENVPQASVVISEPRALFDPFALQTKAVRSPSGYRLSGVKSLVPAAADAELFIVGAELDGRPALFIVESDAQGLVVEADPSMGLRAAGLGRLILDNVAVGTDALLGDGDSKQHAEDYADAVRLARLGWASLAVGTGQAVLDYVIPYVNEREAFGEPISHRQAVAFMVANIAIELDGLRLVTLRGASRAEQGLSFAREAALAKKLATDKGMQFGLDGVQLLGGHGYTKEHPVERWYRDLRGIGVAEGVVLV